MVAPPPGGCRPLATVASRKPDRLHAAGSGHSMLQCLQQQGAQRSRRTARRLAGRGDRRGKKFCSGRSAPAASRPRLKKWRPTAPLWKPSLTKQMCWCRRPAAPTTAVAGRQRSLPTRCGPSLRRIGRRNAAVCGADHWIAGFATHRRYSHGRRFAACAGSDVPCKWREAGPPPLMHRSGRACA